MSVLCNTQFLSLSIHSSIYPSIHLSTIYLSIYHNSSLCFYFRLFMHIVKLKGGYHVHTTKKMVQNLLKLQKKLIQGLLQRQRAVCITTYHYTKLSIYLSNYCTCVSICLSVCLSVYLSIHLSIHPSIHPSIHLYICIYLSIYISIYLSIYQVEEIDERLMLKLSYISSGDCSPIQAVIGSITAQEVMKVCVSIYSLLENDFSPVCLYLSLSLSLSLSVSLSLSLQACSGKFAPLSQWFYFDSLECLHEDEEIHPDMASPQGSRYDGQTAIFGADFQKKLESQKYFVVSVYELQTISIQRCTNSVLSCTNNIQRYTKCLLISD